MSSQRPHFRIKSIVAELVRPRDVSRSIDLRQTREPRPHPTSEIEAWNLLIRDMPIGLVDLELIDPKGAWSHPAHRPSRC